MNQEQGGVGGTTVSACLRERSQRRGRMKEARETLAPVPVGVPCFSRHLSPPMWGPQEDNKGLLK